MSCCFGLLIYGSIRQVAMVYDKLLWYIVLWKYKTCCYGILCRDIADVHDLLFTINQKIAVQPWAAATYNEPSQQDEGKLPVTCHNLTLPVTCTIIYIKYRALEPVV